MTVTALEDPEDDPGELHIVIIEDGLPSYVNEGDPDGVVVEFREADALATVSFAESAHTATEGGAPAAYTLEAAAPARLVTNDPARPDRLGRRRFWWRSVTYPNA